MKVIEKEELDITVGGASFSGAIVNAITSLVKYVYTLGQSLGSSLRRITTGNMCKCK